jgi:spore maturation protein CgeB
MVHPGPDFSVADVYRGWERALRKQGHQVMTYNTNDRIGFYAGAHLPDTNSTRCESCDQYHFKQAFSDSGQLHQMAQKGLFESAYTFWPQVIIFVSGFFTHPDIIKLLKSRGHKIVLLHTESPYQDREQIDRGQYADLNLLNDPTNIDAWKSIGPAVEYMPHAYDPTVHYPAAKPRTYESDFTFIGSAFESRQKFFSEMDFTGLSVTLGGNLWEQIKPEYQGILKFLKHPSQDCVENDETARVYRLSKTGINFYRREGEDDYNGTGWAMGPREIEMAACGLFFLRDPRPESDEVFGGILPVFDGPEDAADQLKWWVRHDAKREEMAKKAQAAIADRTFDNHAKLFMKLLEKI